MNAQRPHQEVTERFGARGRAAIIVVGLVLVLAVTAVFVGLIGTSRSGVSGSGPLPPVSAATPTASPIGPGYSTSAPTPRAAPRNGKHAPGVAPTRGPHKTLAPVPMNDTGRPGPGITAEMTSVRAVESEAIVPGDVAGPAIEVQLRISNDRKRPLDLTQAVVNLYYGAARTPGQPNDSGSAILPRSVPARKAASGTWVFRVPVDQRASVTVELDLGVRHSVVLFRGQAPRA